MICMQLHKNKKHCIKIRLNSLKNPNLCTMFIVIFISTLFLFHFEINFKIFTSVFITVQIKNDNRR